MKIKLISDTHFEFYEDLELYKNPNKADVLVIREIKSELGYSRIGRNNVWTNES